MHSAFEEIIVQERSIRKPCDCRQIGSGKFWIARFALQAVFIEQMQCEGRAKQFFSPFTVFETESPRKKTSGNRGKPMITLQDEIAITKIRAGNHAKFNQLAKIICNETHRFNGQETRFPRMFPINNRE